MPKIIISYRRSDSDAIAGRIRDRLANHYGQDSVFMDIDSIPFGMDFRDHIRDALFDNDILVAVVGPRWLGQGKGAHLRIKEETDPVRIEVETALERGIPVIPVLVDGATMPKPSELPESLRNFAYRNAADVDAGRDFHPHLDRLIRSMDRILERKGKDAAASDGIAPSREDAPAPPPGPAETAREAVNRAASPTQHAAPPSAPSETQPAGPRATTLADLPSTRSDSTGVRKPARTGLLVALAAGAGAALTVVVAGVAIWLYAGRMPLVSPVETPKLPPQVTVAPQLTPPAVVAGGCQETTPAFHDDFKTADPAWNLSSQTETYYADGQFAIKASTDTSWAVIYRSLIYKNAIVCLGVKSPPTMNDQDVGAGVIFWAADYRNYYVAVILTDGRYRISRKVNGSWSTASPSRKFDGIKQGFGVVNRVKVAMLGNIATLYINDQKVQDLKGQPPKAGGSIGMYGASEKGQVTEWRYLDIAVAELPASQTGTSSPSEAVTKAMLAACKLGPTAAFADDFKTLDPSWAGLADDKAYYADGQLKIKAALNSRWEVAYWGMVYKDITVCADLKSPHTIKAVNDTAGGVIFWATGFPNYYMALVNADGSYTINRRVDSSSIVTVAPKTSHAAINKGPDAQNRVKVTLNNNIGTLYINDVKMQDFRGQPPADPSAVGLVGESEADQRDDWGFSGLVVTETQH